MTTTVRYLIGVQRLVAAKKIWQYASNVTNYPNQPSFGPRENAKMLRSAEEARKWFDWAKGYFDDYRYKNVNFDWSSLCVVKQTLKEEVEETLLDE